MEARLARLARLARPAATAPTADRRPARPRWTARITSTLGAFGVTAALGLGGATALTSQCAPPPPSPQQQVVDLTNQRRADYGIAPVAVHALLTNAAQAHSEDQAAADRMSHTGTDGSDPGTRIARQGYRFRAWGENVAVGYPDAASVVNAWMESPSHRANILNGTYTQIGIGLAYAADGSPYWTMDLARPG